MFKYIVFLLFLAHHCIAQNTSTSLNSNWQFYNKATNKWYAAAVPGTIHTDLLSNKLIDDPFYRDNESKLKWIDQADWDYRKQFDVDAASFSKRNIELVFDGLDTYADVFLNGQLILQAENMFRQYRIDVKSLLKKSGNLLQVRFSSAKNKVDSIAKSRLPLVLPDNNRVYVRKAQYHFGWDWGPIFTGCGIWKGVRLEGWDRAKMENIKIVLAQKTDTLTKLAITYTIRSISAFGFITGIEGGEFESRPGRLVFNAGKSNAGKTFTNWHSWSAETDEDVFSDTLYIRNPTYWNSQPGKNKIYHSTVYLYVEHHRGGMEFAETVPLDIGLRDLQLIQQPDSIGKSFYFQVNGKPIFAKGANYIPSDVFLPRIKKADYRKILQSAKDANMNMLRVWGGGVYEADEFYDLCDSMGIMVWQDFMFACGMYPGDDHFFANVREEVKYQIERLRNHPCIVLWCGNNEVDEAWHNWGWQGQFNLHGTDSAKVWNDYERLFKDSLQKWVDEFDGTRSYVSTSPKNGWGHKESFTEGDSHYWGLWWGLEDWEVFRNKTGRFVSEWGMQAMPNQHMIEQFTLPGDRYRNSPIINAHQKASNGFDKIDHYLNRYFIDSPRLAKLSFEDYNYLTQCMQYYILKNSIAVHRSKAPNTMGTLLWQLNDCWPVSSWSITDYNREPKAAWYAVKEAYRDDALPKEDSVYPKDLGLKPPKITIDFKENYFIVSSDVDTKYVYLHSSIPGIIFSENYFDLKAGQKIKITPSKKLGGGDVKAIRVRSLFDVINN